MSGSDKSKCEIFVISLSSSNFKVPLYYKAHSCLELYLYISFYSKDRHSKLLCFLLLNKLRLLGEMWKVIPIKQKRHYSRLVNEDYLRRCRQIEEYSTTHKFYDENGKRLMIPIKKKYKKMRKMIATTKRIFISFHVSYFFWLTALLSRFCQQPFVMFFNMGIQLIKLPFSTKKAKTLL